MSKSNNEQSDGSKTEPIMEMITAYEYKRVLAVAGFSHKRLARHLMVSRSYVTGVANGYVRMTFRHTQELEGFLGTRLFKASLTKVRRDLELQRQHSREAAQRYAAEQAALRAEMQSREAAEREKRALEIEGELARASSNSPES